jgi:hypothetical protein
MRKLWSDPGFLNATQKGPASANVPAGSTALKDSDFPTDARARKAADAEALERAKERREAMTAEKGDGPPEEEESFLGTLVDKAKDKVGKMADDIKIPRFGGDAEVKPEDASALVQFLQDMEDDLGKAQEYIAFIEKHRERLDYVAKAAEQLDKINKQLKGGLDKVSKGLGKVSEVINKAKKMVKWGEAMRDFAGASKQMKASDRDSVKRWVTSLEKLWNASADFEKELKSAWWEAVLAESAMAYAAAPLILAGTTLYLGIRTLRAGVENVDAYFDRLEKVMKEIDASEGHAAQEPEFLADYPGEWQSREEREARAQAVKDSNRQMAARNAEARKKQDATDAFNESVFPTLYKQYRPTLRKKILADFQKTGDSTWSECLLLSGGDSYHDENLGVEVTPTKENVTDKDGIDTEIGNFRGLEEKGKGCPYFKALYDAGLKKHLEKALAGKK